MCIFRLVKHTKKLAQVETFLILSNRFLKKTITILLMPVLGLKPWDVKKGVAPFVPSRKYPRKSTVKATRRSLKKRAFETTQPEHLTRIFLSEMRF